MSEEQTANFPPTDTHGRRLSRFGAVVLICVISFLIVSISFLAARLNYPLFHTFADGITVFVAASIFSVVWSGRKRLDNQFYLFAGIAFLSFAFLDFIHLLATRNLGVFPGYGANLTAQLYIASRYVLGVSLLIAPLFVKRRFNPFLVIVIYALVTLFIILSVFSWKIFPVTFIDGQGLTTFKVASDYIVCAILLAAVFSLVRNRRSFDSTVFKSIIAALVLSITTGLAFTLYTDPFGIMNMSGHLLQIASFSFFYAAVVETSITRPENLLFRNLRLNEEKYRTLFENMTEGFAHCRMIYQGDTPADWIYLDVNPAFEKITGIKGAAGKNVNDLIPGIKETNPELFDYYGRVAKGGPPEQFESYLPALDMWLSISVFSPRKDYFVAVFHNISERIKAEQALLKSEERYRTIVTTANEGIWMVDANRRTLFVNDKMASLLGYTTEEMISLPWQKLTDSSGHNLSDEKMKIRTQGLANGHETYEFKLCHKDGTPKWFLVSASLQYDHSGKYSGSISMLTDITDRKQAEQLKDEFIGMVSHELKTPLTVIIGALATASDPRVSPHDARELMSDAVNHAGILANLVDNLLELSRQQSNRLVLKPEPVDVGAVVQTVLANLKRKSDIHRLSSEVSPNLPPAVADPIRVERIIHNLVDNAIKYSPDGGEVKVSGRQMGGFLIFAVQDHGPGIAVADQDKLFQSFERLGATVKGSIQGTGLGLRVCRILAEAHGGKIWVESEPGKGATFFFTLPAAKI